MDNETTKFQSAPNNETIKFQFTLDQTNALLSALGQLPYQQAHSLVEMIMVQGHEQAMAIIERQRGAQDEADPQASAAAAA